MSKYRGLVFEQHRYWGVPGSASPAVATTQDDSRYDNEGTNTDITYTQLPSGLWVNEFNGASSLINCGDIALLDGAVNLTLECWAWFNSQQNNSGLLSKKLNTAAPVNEVFSLQDAQWLGNAQQLVFQIRESGAATQEFLDPDQYELNQWKHWVAIYDNINGNGELWKNGQQKISAALGVGNFLESNDAPVLIGATWTVTDCHDGNITLARIYNYALSPDEINRHFEAERRFFGV